MEPALIGFQLLNGLVWGWAVALMALGLNLIYGILRVINVAHGAFYMLGAVVGWSLLHALQSISDTYSLNFAVALLVAPMAVGVLGAVLQRAVFPPTPHPVQTIIITFGLMIAIQQAVQLLFGSARYVPSPLNASLALWGLRYPLYRLALAGAAVVLICVLWLFLHRTRWGLWSRAVRQDAALALTLGIPVPRVHALVFGLGTALAAAAGFLVAPIVSVEAHMGMDILIETFMVVIVGGLGSLPGAVLAALAFRMSEGLLTVWFDPISARVLALLLMGATLLVRPHGLWPVAESRDDE